MGFFFNAIIFTNLIRKYYTLVSDGMRGGSTGGGVCSIARSLRTQFTFFFTAQRVVFSNRYCSTVVLVFTSTPGTHVTCIAVFSVFIYNRGLAIAFFSYYSATDAR